MIYCSSSIQFLLDCSNSSAKISRTIDASLSYIVDVKYTDTGLFGCVKYIMSVNILVSLGVAKIRHGTCSGMHKSANDAHTPSCPLRMGHPIRISYLVDGYNLQCIRCRHFHPLQFLDWLHPNGLNGSIFLRKIKSRNIDSKIILVYFFLLNINQFPLSYTNVSLLLYFYLY